MFTQLSDWPKMSQNYPDSFAVGSLELNVFWTDSAFRDHGMFPHITGLRLQTVYIYIYITCYIPYSMNTQKYNTTLYYIYNYIYYIYTYYHNYIYIYLCTRFDAYSKWPKRMLLRPGSTRMLTMDLWTTAISVDGCRTRRGVGGDRGFGTWNLGFIGIYRDS